MKGYPQKRAGGTTVRVHRLVWEQHTLGTFATLEEAAEARRGAERARFGSFARG